jgi:radical SAM protein with 4Fe4S-binding SPASM domain
MQIDAPIIIIGAGRSGSTLLDRMLDAHPDIHMLGETDFFAFELYDKLLQGRKKALVGNDSIEFACKELKRLGQLACATISGLFELPYSGKSLWGIKEIWNGDTFAINWAIYDLIFPSATWVHLVRNPLYYALSAANWNGGELTEALLTNKFRAWVRMLNLSRERCSTGRYVEIRYEDLVEDPENSLIPLFNKIGLTFSPSCLEPLNERWVPSTVSPQPPNAEMVEKLITGLGIEGVLDALGYRDLVSQSYPINAMQDAKAVPEEYAFAKLQYQFEMPLDDGSSASNFMIMNSSRIEPAGGQAFTYWAPLLVGESDHVGSHEKSTYVMMEDSVPIGPAHSLHENIHEIGHGHWSHWGQFILFSSSDATDPRTNGRKYVLIKHDEPLIAPEGSALVGNPIRCPKTAVTDTRVTSPCAYPWQQMIIDLTGEVVPCCFWSGYGNTGKPLGNTNVSSLTEIWNGEEYQALRKANATGDLEGHPCHQCMAYAWSNGNYPSFSSPIPWRHESGHCYLVEIPDSYVELAGESLKDAEFLENGVALALPKAAHDDIRRSGLGRYSVWGRSLYFSTSDNSDPSDNGRSYELSLPAGRVKLQGLVTDSASGQNILKAREEYVAGTGVMTAKPTMISLISTADCNIDCPGCSQNMVRLVKVQHRAETVPDVLAHVPYLYQFIWHGGEPYLIKRFRQFIDEFRTEDNPNLAFGFTSNGTMLTAKELEKLDKFPRINASISVDSFNRETFEQIRAGANYDKVLANTLRAVATYDAPDRVFSVGMVICKSNFLELPANLDYAIEHDIGLNLSPVVIYPVTEQLNIFSDFIAQTNGWRDAIEEARRIVSIAKQDDRAAIRRVDPTGMLDAIEAILNDAQEHLRDTETIEFELRDPLGALNQMRRPGILVIDEGGRPLCYTAVTSPVSAIYKLAIPAGATARRWQFLHDLYEPMGIVRENLIPSNWRDRTPAVIRIPQFVALDRQANGRYAQYGETTPEGLHVANLQQITGKYLEVNACEAEAGKGVQSRSLQTKLQAELSNLRNDPNLTLVFGLLIRLVKKWNNHRIVLSGPFENVGGMCWRMNGTGLAEIADDLSWQDSPILLWEGPTLLGPAHSTHGQIQNFGEGRYSCWSDSLYFSSSDNSDPNTNGKSYSLEIFFGDDE